MKSKEQIEVNQRVYREVIGQQAEEILSKERAKRAFFAKMKADQDAWEESKKSWSRKTMNKIFGRKKA